MTFICPIVLLSPLYHTVHHRILDLFQQPSYSDCHPKKKKKSEILDTISTPNRRGSERPANTAVYAGVLAFLITFFAPYALLLVPDYHFVNLTNFIYAHFGLIFGPESFISKALQNYYLLSNCSINLFTEPPFPFTIGLVTVL